VNQYLAAWSYAGLETTLYTAILTAVVFAAPERITASRFLASSILCFLISLTRPEGVVIYGIVLVVTFAN